MNGYVFVRDTLPTIVSIASSSVLAIFSCVLVYRSSTKDRRAKKAERLQKQLDDFYYPFALRMKQNTELRKLFGKKYDDEYRILTELLKGKKFEGNDKVLLESIKENDKVLNNLILNNQSKVDSELNNDLALLSSHYTLFILACDGKLSNEIERFESHVHPNEVTNKIDAKIEKIEKKIEGLIK